MSGRRVVTSEPSLRGQRALSSREPPRGSILSMRKGNNLVRLPRSAPASALRWAAAAAAPPLHRAASCSSRAAPCAAPGPGSPPLPAARRPAAPLSANVCPAPGTEVPFNLHVAPMKEYTDRHFRHLARLLSRRARLWTEMEKAKALIASPPHKQDALLRHSQTGACGAGAGVLQLGGDTPADLAEAAALAVGYGYEELNLNCGCPSVETGGGSYGARLMQHPGHVRALVEAMAEGCRGAVPVTVKCRTGAVDAVAAAGRGGAGLQAPYEELAEFVREVAEGGTVSHFVVHARCAVLGGLSPVKNRTAPALQPELVYRLAADFPALRFTLNGGVADFADVASHGGGHSTSAASALEGVMAGRWFLRQPWDLLMVDEQVYGEPPPCSAPLARQEVVTGYMEYAAREVAAGRALRGEVAKPLVLLAEGLEAAYMSSEAGSDEEATWVDTAEHLMHWVGGSEWVGGTSRDVCALGLDAQRTPRFRQLRKVLQKCIGKKVYQKIQKNRGECVDTPVAVDLECLGAAAL